MSQSTETSPKPTTEPLKLTAEAVNYLIKILPKGNRLLYRDRFSSDDEWSLGTIEGESS